MHIHLESIYVCVHFCANHLTEGAANLSLCVFISEALVDILLTVVKLSPSVCESSHLAVLLGAYGATLSTVGMSAWERYFLPDLFFIFIGD